MQRARHHIFSFYHPVVIFLYLVAVIGCAMCTRDPLYVALAVVGSATYVIYLKGVRSYLESLRFTLPLFIVIALFNPLFGGLGMTVLFYLGETPFTLESLVFGLCSAGMLVAVIQWFTAYQEIMTTERFLSLFGGVAPTIVMMIAMVLRYVPLVSRKAGQIQMVQTASVGEGVGVKARISSSVRMSSVLMNWSMESSIVTADSMRARGYGEGPRRTNAAGRNLTSRDVIALVALVVLAAANLALVFTVGQRFEFYPTLSEIHLEWGALVLYTALMLFPLILEGREQLAWASSHS